MNLLDGGDQDSDAEDEATLFRQVQLQLKKKEIKRKYSQSYRNKLENWENCESINLSFQDVGHNYQRREFFRVLRRLVRCQHIQLMDNSLGDMSAIIFPRCTELYLQRNFVNHFKVGFMFKSQLSTLTDSSFHFVHLADSSLNVVQLTSQV